VRGILEEDFIALLPLLRRTFSQFSHAERRKIGEKANRPGSGHLMANVASADQVDHERGIASLPVVMQLLGLKNKPGAPAPIAP
jgi:hypothetical protein